MNVALLHNSRVELICFAAYSTYLHFDNGIVITIESDFQFFDEGSDGDPPYTSFPLKESSLMAIIEKEVLDASIDDTKSLRLCFSNGKQLIVPKLPLYESYKIDRLVKPAQTESLTEEHDTEEQ